MTNVSTAESTRAAYRCAVCGRFGPVTDRGTPFQHRAVNAVVGHWCSGSAILAEGQRHLAADRD